MEYLHTNFVQKLNDEAAATIGGREREREREGTGEMRLGFWSGEVACLFVCWLG